VGFDKKSANIQIVFPLQIKYLSSSYHLLSFLAFRKFLAWVSLGLSYLEFTYLLKSIG
jgi:hypothetical protein